MGVASHSIVRVHVCICKLVIVRNTDEVLAAFAGIFTVMLRGIQVRILTNVVLMSELSTRPTKIAGRSLHEKCL